MPYNYIVTKARAAAGEIVVAPATGNRAKHRRGRTPRRPSFFTTKSALKYLMKQFYGFDFQQTG